MVLDEPSTQFNYAICGNTHPSISADRGFANSVAY